MNIVKVEQKTYPRLLKEIVGAPNTLYVKGDVAVLQNRMVAVVGSRVISNRAKMKVELVVEELVGKGFVIVSGLARGVDRLAHEAALKFGGKTIGVLAHGLHRIYPPEHTKLAEKIIEMGGAVVSEHDLGVEPKRNFFLERNRIVVGMSEMLVLIEAKVVSGSMSSANHAAEMGREVLAVSGSPGTDLLISEGVMALSL